MQGAGEYEEFLDNPIRTASSDKYALSMVQDSTVLVGGLESGGKTQPEFSVHFMSTQGFSVLFVVHILVARFGSCVVFQSETTIDGFIYETRDTLRGWTRFPSKLYNISDKVVTGSRTIQLSGFCIQTHARKKFMQILSSDGMECSFKLDSFCLAVHYPPNRTGDPDAFILDLNAIPSMSGTDALLLVLYILRRIGARSCSLQNFAKLPYEYRAESNCTITGSYIQLIHLRCIKGKNSDWYSDFGFFNGQQAQIAREMERIHDSPAPCNYHGIPSLGPLLYSLWNQSDKAEFHTTYQSCKSRFHTLTQLRDHCAWTAEFAGSFNFLYEKTLD